MKSSHTRVTRRAHADTAHCPCPHPDPRVSDSVGPGEARGLRLGGVPSQGCCCWSGDHAVRTSAVDIPHQVKAAPSWGPWVAQSDKRPTSARVMISRFVSSSPTLGSVLMAQSPGACFRFCVSLSLFPSLACSLSFSLPKIR